MAFRAMRQANKAQDDREEAARLQAEADAKEKAAKLALLNGNVAGAAVLKAQSDAAEAEADKKKREANVHTARAIHNIRR